jgi:hypothetical protein
MVDLVMLDLFKLKEIGAWASCPFDGLNAGRKRDGVEPNLGLLKCRFQDQEKIPVVIRPKMTVQIFRVPPHFFEHQNVLFQYVPVDVATMTARFVSALLRHRSEDLQCLRTLLGWDRHPDGREYHSLSLSISGLLVDSAAVFNDT